MCSPEIFRLFQSFLLAVEFVCFCRLKVWAEGPHSSAHWFLLVFTELSPPSLAESSRDCLRLISWFICLDQPEDGRQSRGFSTITLLSPEIGLSSSRCSVFLFCGFRKCWNAPGGPSTVYFCICIMSLWTFTDIYEGNTKNTQENMKLHCRVLMERIIKGDLLSTGVTN